jgi:predicted phosphodiesterase
VKRSSTHRRNPTSAYDLHTLNRHSPYPFILFKGDVPYNARDAVKLEEQMSTIPEDARFVIHLGDLRSANEGLDCVRSDYTDVASILRLSRAPVFAVIGDNDWNDCPNRNQGRNFWENEFNGFDTKYWNHTFQVVRQPERTENFAFVDQGTLFIGLNIVGGLVHDRNEWETRLTDQVKWTKNLIREYNPTDRVGSVVIFGHANPTQNHNAFFVPLTDFIANELQNQLPILYLNGDKHTWNYEPSFFDQPSFLRITVTGGTSEPPLKVSAETGRSAVEEVFTYDRQL